jgi:hypothetical protein
MTVELLFFLQQKKSNQKNAAATTAPLKNRGSQEFHAVIMLCQNSQRTLRHAGAENS